MFWLELDGTFAWCPQAFEPFGTYQIATLFYGIWAVWAAGDTDFDGDFFFDGVFTDGSTAVLYAFVAWGADGFAYIGVDGYSGVIHLRVFAW